LPEKFNSMIWVRDAKDTLAFGNISGAMVFQSTIPVTLGLLFTKWQLNSLNVFAVGLALTSGAMLYMLLRGKRPIRAPYLLTGGVMYAAFVVAAVLTALP
jgi:cation:H+ antiporter